MLLLIEFAHDAADRIYKAIVASEPGAPRLRPILKPYDTVGSTRYVDFDTTKPVYATRPDKCHVSHVVEDSSYSEEDGGYVADIPDLEACSAFGRTPEEALREVEKARTA